MSKSETVTLDCFINQKRLLNCFGLFHNQNVLCQVYPVGLLISLTIYLFSIIPEISKVYYVDYKKFIFCSVIEIGQLTALICMFLIFWSRFELKQLFEKLKLLDNLSSFKNAEGENVFIKEYHDTVKKQTNFGIAWVTIIQVLFISISVVISLNEEKWILPFGIGSAVIKNNNLQFIVQITIFNIFSINLILIQFIHINMMTLICGHCKLLRIYIALSFTGFKGKISKELNLDLIETEIPDWKLFKIQLQQIVPYHVGIIDAANQMESVFSLITFVLCGGISICMCLLTYYTQLNVGILETVKGANILILCYSLLIIVSSYGEKVASDSGKIASACYELDFVGCDLRIQKSLILIMTISQRPITPTIGKIQILGLPAMLSILQSIYSYYTILRNVMNVNE